MLQTLTAGEGSGGLESFNANGEYTTVTNNVFVRDGISPWLIAASSAQGWTITRNTFFGTSSTKANGVSIDNARGQAAGNVVRDKLFAGNSHLVAPSGTAVPPHLPRVRRGGG